MGLRWEDEGWGFVSSYLRQRRSEAAWTNIPVATGRRFSGLARCMSAA